MTNLSDWNSAAIGDVCEMFSGATPRTAVPSYWGGEIAWLTPKDMALDQSKVLFGGGRSLTRAGFESCSAAIVPAGSVIISSRAPVGYVAIAGRDLATNQGCKSALPPSDIDSSFLYWQLVSLRMDLQSRASGTTFKEISGKEFARTIIRWPHLAEQRRIVSVLEGHLSRLSAASAYLDVAHRRSEMFRLQWLASQSRGSWASTSLADVVSEAKTGWDRGRQYRDVSGAGFPYLKMNNITRTGDLDLGEVAYVTGEKAEADRYRVREGDLLLNNRNSQELVGKCALVPGPASGWTYNNNLVRLRLVEAVDPAFLALQLAGRDFRQQVSRAASGTTNVAALYTKDLLRLRVDIPDLERQRQVVLEYGRLRSSLARINIEVSMATSRTISLRLALVSAAFSGQSTKVFSVAS